MSRLKVGFYLKNHNITIVSIGSLSPKFNNTLYKLQELGGLCPASGQEANDLTADLDPDIENCNRTFAVFRQCKANCRGGTKKIYNDNNKAQKNQSSSESGSTYWLTPGQLMVDKLSNNCKKRP